MASIEKRLIHLGNTPGTDTPYFHRYTIHTKDNGEQWVLRSGPSSNPSGGIGSIIIGDASGNVNDGFGTIDFTYEKYRNSDGSVYMHLKEDGSGEKRAPLDIEKTDTLHLTSGPIIEGDDQFVDQIISKMASKGNSIEGDNIPYSPTNQNSNTADAHGWEDALGGGYYDSAEYEVILGTGSQSQELIDEIRQNGGSVKDEDLFIPATTEDFEQNVNLATVAWDLVEDSGNWLSNKIGKPLIDIIKESGGTVSDWMSEVAEQIGETSSSLFNSAKDFFSDLFDLEDNKFTAYEGDKIIQLANSGQIATDAVYVDSDGNPVSEYDALFTTTDSDGNIFTIVKDDISVTLSNGTKALVSSVIEMGEIAVNATKEFMNGYLGQIDKLFNTADGVAGLISDVAAGIQRGDSPEEIAKFIATKLAVKQLLDQGSAAIKQQIQEALVGNAADQAIIEAGGDLSGLSSQGAEKIASLDAITSHPAFQFGYTVAITYAATLLLSADEGWDSEEYAIAAAQLTAQVAAQMTVAYLMPQGAAAASGAGGGLAAGAGSAAGAAYAGAAAAAAYLVSAAITDLFADDSMNSHQWQNTVVSAAVIGVAAAIGFLAGGPIGAAIASVIVSQFMGGKEYKDGEYPDPYSFLHIEEKEDGTGQSIYGVEKEGVVAMAREHYHDDIIGTNGSDILVGRSGTNLLVGNDGDDLLEGRGDTDQIYGGDGNDIIEAGNENDYVQGDAGNDLIYGDGGDDILLGGEGNDIIYGGIGADRIEGNEGVDIIKGEAGNDEIDSGAGNDVIDGGAGIDILVGGEGNDNIRGGDNNDEIYGSLGSDILYGDIGSDILNGGEENDLVFGGIGNDIVYGGAGDDVVYGEIGDDYVLGGQGNDIADGFDGDDVLFAGKGNDTLDGGRGLDTFVFRAGDGQDTITDTDGANDVIKFTDINSSQITLTKNNNNLVITFTDTNGNPTTDQIIVTDQLVGNNVIETLEFTDGKKIELTNLTTNTDNTTNYTTESYYNIDTAIQSGLAQEYSEELDIEARDQVNTDSTWYDSNFDNQDKGEIENEHYNEVQWKSYKAKRNAFGGHYTKWYKYYETNLKGTDGNDRLVGNWWSENMYGEGGDDQLYGNNGNDVIYGQEGNDYINGGADADNLYGGNGHDKIEGGTGNDNIYGGNDNDTLYGQWGADTIYGGSGDDFIDGGDEDDIISGDITAAKIAEIQTEINNLNNVSYVLGGGFGFISRKFTTNPEQIAALQELITNLESGNDIILGGDGNDTVTGDEGNDLVIGNAGNDNLSGNEGNDTIYGRRGNDIIKAGDGDDYVSGADGYDIISGNEGNDILYGNGGVDVISGNDGNDNIYGGSGNDQLFGNLGNDNIYGGSGSNIIEGNEGDDNITGGEDYDRIEGGVGNDTIFGRSGGDELYGGAGNDIISAGQGNDILIDGTGDDNLIGGSGNDIFIITKNDQVADEDTIEDFDANKDRVIIKVDYKNPITFATLQSLMSQNGSNTEINFDNGQKIIIKNTLLSDLTEDNVAIGLAGGEDNEILFGTNSDDVLFGEGGNDQIYGGAGNDELWGGKGADALYGEEGNDTLRFEADDTFLDEQQKSLVYYDEEENNALLSSLVGLYIILDYRSYDFQSLLRNYYNNDDIYYKHSDSVVSSYVTLAYSGGSLSTAFYQPIYHNNYDYKHYYTKNFYTDEQLNINGYNRSFDSFDGGSGSDILLMTEGDDMLSLNDPTSSNPNQGVARLTDISVIYANDGNDIINLTSPNYTHGDIIIYGGNGNDRIWSSIGNDILFGGSGDDEIYGGAGNDFISGGDDNDVLIGGTGNDVIEGGSGDDEINGEAGDDIISGGVGADILDGGEGDEINGDTVSYSTSTSGVTVNIADNTASGADASGDTISNFENITGSNFVDNLTGDANNNIIEGKAGDDILNGGLGSDTYIYNIGDGNDTINDGVNNHGDTIILGSSISRSDLLFERSWNDLTIKFYGNDSDSITITNQLADNGSKIETITFSNGDEALDLTNKTYLSEEDITLEIQLNELEEEKMLNQNISLIAAYGTATYNEDTGLISYIPNQDFNGIDQLTYNIADDEGNIIRSKTLNLMVSAINDNPFGAVENQEVMVDEQFNLNLNDFFSDIDGDNLTYLVNVKDQIGLPHWLSLNETTGELSGIFGRDGKVTIEVAVSDGNGGIFNTTFNLTSNIDLSQRVIDIPDLQITNGTDASDTLSAVNNQQDLISAGAGDDNINYVQDSVWQDTSNENFFAWNVYSGDKVSIAGRLQSFDSFDGGIGSDTLNLTDGNDVIFLDDPVTSSLSNSARLSGIEIINGGLGNDIIDLSSLNYEYGDVTLNGGDGDDILWSNSGDDILNGGAGNDNLQAGTGNDILNGDEGDDILKGHDGNESLIGGSGADTLTGGFGFDSFNFTALDESTINQSDLITDFTQGDDSINFSNLGFTAITAGQGSGTILGYTYDQESDVTTIEDVNSDFAVQLSGKIDLVNSDFSF